MVQALNNNNNKTTQLVALLRLYPGVRICIHRLANRVKISYLPNDDRKVQKEERRLTWMKTTLTS